MKTFIVSVGTSVKTNYLRAHKKTKNLNKKKMIKFLKENYLNEDLFNTSAEIKTLTKIGINKNDKLVFISTDTKDGIFCSEVLKDFYIDFLDIKDVEIRIIKGLQVEDAKLFKEEGIKNLYNEIHEIIIKNAFSDIVLVISGGFKANVPYLTLFGMLFSVPVYYIFENTEELIKLFPLPIKYDFSIFEDFENMFKRVEKESHLNERSYKEFLKGVSDRSIIESLFYKKEGEYYLTDIGLLLFKAYKFRNKE